MNTLKKHIGIIGVGLMGTSIGHRLLDHGYILSIWNRNRHEASELLDRGAIWSENPLSDCERVIVSLYSSEIVRAVIERFQDGICPGQIIIDTTTGNPWDAEEMAEFVARRGATYIESPVSGSSHQTRQGDVMIMVGGDYKAYEICTDIWSVLARTVHYTGGSGSAARMKLVTNLVLGLNRAALAEGLTFADSIGVDPVAALELLKNSAAASRVMDVKGDKMIRSDFSAQAKLSQHLKDVDIILQLAAEHGIVLPLSSVHQNLLRSAEALGCGDLDNSAIIQTYRNKPNSNEL